MCDARTRGFARREDTCSPGRLLPDEILIFRFPPYSAQKPARIRGLSPPWPQMDCLIPPILSFGPPAESGFQNHNDISGKETTTKKEDIGPHTFKTWCCTFPLAITSNRDVFLERYGVYKLWDWTGSIVWVSRTDSSSSHTSLRLPKRQTGLTESVWNSEMRPYLMLYQHQ